MAAFGQTEFGQYHIWPNLTGRMAAFGQTEFGQYHIWPKLTGRIWPSLFGRIWPIFVDRIWPDRIWPIFCFGGGPKSGGLKGWGPEGVGPEGSGAQNFALFLLSPPGFHTTAREPKHAHFSVPAFQNSTRIHPEREERKLWRETEKKSAKFWAVRRRGVRGGGVWGRGGLSQHPNLGHTHENLGHHHNTTPHNTTQHHTTHTTHIGQKRIGQKWIGQKCHWPKMSKILNTNFGQKWIGQNWPAKHNGQKWPKH